MSAQRPGRSLSPSTCDGGRSFVFYNGKRGYDYLTQLPYGGKELMFGGGGVFAEDRGLGEVGVVDDSTWNWGVAGYLSGALSGMFGERNWGEEGRADVGGQDGDLWAKGRVKAIWSGILGASVDGVPWVGKIPSKISGRLEPDTTTTATQEYLGKRTLAAPGEWIAAGYSGEGMVHAWMSGKAVGLMVLGKEEEERVGDWLPGCMRIGVKRWKKASLYDLAGSL
jgi:hypothetical protein